MPQGKTEEIGVSFSRDLGLFDACMIGIGAMIGAGIFVLTGIAAGVAGPGAIAAFALNGVVTLLTALSYAELASAFPESGGGYSYIKKAFPGAVGFASGWMLWFSYIVACSLYAMGFGSYFWELIKKYLAPLHDAAARSMGETLPALLVTFLIGLVFVGINIRGTAVTGKVENILTISKILVLGVFILYGLNRIFGDPAQAASSFTPFLPNGFNAVILAMGLTFIAFEGYDLIATVAEEIKQPERNIPIATVISLSVTVVIYLLVMVVCIGAIRPEEGSSWEFLGRFQETAVVQAASSFMPGFGTALIVFGGLLSTLSALNATILASSRVAFSMGREKMLPASVTMIHPVRRTPQVAIAWTGGIMLILVFLFPIQVIGSAASLLFLLTFALVNLALIALRRKSPEVVRRFKVPLYPVTPIAAIILNVALALYQYQFDPRSWYIAGAWVVTGVLVYFAYFEKKIAPEMPQVLEVRRSAEFQAARYRILIPLHNPDHVAALMKLAIPIAREREGEIVVLSVIDIPQNLPVHEGMRFVHHKTPLLNNAIRIGQGKGIDVRPAVWIAHRIYDGILRAAETEKASLILMGWKGFTSTRDRILGEVTDRVVHHAPCDLITVKLSGDLDPQRILLPTAGGHHSTLASEFVHLYQREYGAEVTCSYVVPDGADPGVKETAHDWIEKAIHLTGLEKTAKRMLIESGKVATGLVKASAGFDLVVLGASQEGIFSSVLFGEIPEKVARYSRTPVMIVKRYEGAVKSLVKKVIG